MKIKAKMTNCTSENAIQSPYFVLEFRKLIPLIYYLFINIQELSSYVEPCNQRYVLRCRHENKQSILDQ